MVEFLNRAAGYNITINQGEAFNLSVETYTGTESDNERMDLTGYTAKMQVKTAANAEDVAVEVTTKIEDNVINLSLTSAQTAAIPVKGKTWTEYEVFVYDLIITNGDNFYRILNGQFLISPMVTKVG